MPWLPPGIVGEDRGVTIEVQNLVGTVRLRLDQRSAQARCFRKHPQPAASSLRQAVGRRCWRLPGARLRQPSPGFSRSSGRQSDREPSQAEPFSGIHLGSRSKLLLDALTIATMPALIASDSSGQAARSRLTAPLRCRKKLFLRFYRLSRHPLHTSSTANYGKEVRQGPSSPRSSMKSPVFFDDRSET